MRIKRCKHGIDLYMIVDFGCVKRKQGIAFILGSLFHAGILIDTEIAPKPMMRKILKKIKKV